MSEALKKALIKSVRNSVPEILENSSVDLNVYSAKSIVNLVASWAESKEEFLTLEAGDPELKTKAADWFTQVLYGLA